MVLRVGENELPLVFSKSKLWQKQKGKSSIEKHLFPHLSTYKIFKNIKNVLKAQKYAEHSKWLYTEL